MNFLKTLPAVAGLLAVCTSLGMAVPTEQLNSVSDLEHYLPLIMKTLFAQRKSSLVTSLIGALQDNENTTPLDPIDLPIPEVGWIQLAQSTIVKKSFYTDNKYETDDTTASVDWTGNIGSLLWTIPTYNISLTIPPVGPIPFPALRTEGRNMEIGFTGFKSTLHAKGPFNTEDMKLDELEVTVEIKFSGKGDGDLVLGEKNIPWSDVAGSLNSVFTLLWNDCSAPVINDYIKCALNIAVEDCTVDNFDNGCVIKEEGFADPTCTALLESWDINEPCDPDTNYSTEPYNSANAFQASFFLLVLLTWVVKLL